MLRQAMGVLHAVAKAAMPTPGVHYVLKTPFRERPPAGMEVAIFGSGCFWGSEEVMWKTPGVYTTSVGYTGGETEKPTYSQICTGQTGHAEAVRVVYDPKKVSFVDLVTIFWQSHDPTQGNRQGNDRGTQYRSVIYTMKHDHMRLAEASKAAYEKALAPTGRGSITTELKCPAPCFHFAEESHQQYLAKPGNRQYCSAQPTGVRVPAAEGWMPADLVGVYRPYIKPDNLPNSRCAGGSCSL